MLNGNVMIIHLIVGLIKKNILLYKMNFFSEHAHSNNEIKVKLDLSNYAAKSGLKSATAVDTSKCAKGADLATLKSDIDESDTDKFETTPAGLSKLSHKVKNEVIKKIEYNELVKKVNAIETTDTSNLIKKSDYDTKIEEIEKKYT